MVHNSCTLKKSLFLEVPSLYFLFLNPSCALNNRNYRLHCSAHHLYLNALFHCFCLPYNGSSSVWVHYLAWSLMRFKLRSLSFYMKQSWADSGSLELDPFAALVALHAICCLMCICSWSFRAVAMCVVYPILGCYFPQEARVVTLLWLHCCTWVFYTTRHVGHLGLICVWEEGCNFVSPTVNWNIYRTCFSQGLNLRTLYCLMGISMRFTGPFGG